MTAAAVEPAEKVEIPFNKQPRDWRKAGIIVAFCAVPVALLVIFTYWPFGSMIGYSFYKMKYIGPREFVGLKNYIDVFTRPDTLSSLKLSLYYMAGALIQVGLALYLSSMLRSGPRRQRFQGHLLLPVPDQRHCSRLHLQVLLHTWLRVRYCASMVRIPA